MSLKHHAIGALTLLSLATVATPASGQWEVPRTSWGHPDLQGNWSNATLTPLVRPRDRGPVLTWEEAEEIESGQAEFVQEAAAPSDPDRPLPPGGDNPVCIDAATTCYNEVYRDPGDRVAVVNGEPRSSLITFPEDGRIPPLTESAREWRRERTEFTNQFGAYDNPENRPLAERCIVSFGSSAGPPMLPNYWYNNNYTIVQNEDHVLILAEMVHDVRIIRLGEPQPLPDDVRPYFGDSWGHWEGNTLVVETTNINPEHSFQGVPQSSGGKIIERFTRVAEDEILYEFEIDDPKNYTSVWGGQVPFHRFDDQVLEYSCHEGNYALEGVLRGARFQESEGGGLN